MLAQTSGHKVMKNQIENQKKTTRDALSYVAELKRERSIFYSPFNSLTSQFDSISQFDKEEKNSLHFDEDKVEERKSKLIELL